MSYSQCINIDYKKILSSVYRESAAKFNHSKEDVETLEKRHISPVYGELLVPSMATLFQSMAISDNDVLIDLGSGLGKLVLSAFLSTPLKKVIGIEGVLNLHQQSQSVLETTKERYPSLFLSDRSISYHLGNFLNYDFNQASLLYACSTCFSQELLWLLGKKINDSTHVKKVITLSPMPSLERLSFKKTFTLECSWDTAVAYCYE